VNGKRASGESSQKTLCSESVSPPVMSAVRARPRSLRLHLSLAPRRPAAGAAACARRARPRRPR
jgi:hypothetical protein